MGQPSASFKYQIKTRTGFASKLKAIDIRRLETSLWRHGKTWGDKCTETKRNSCPVGMFAEFFLGKKYSWYVSCVFSWVSKVFIRYIMYLLYAMFWWFKFNVLEMFFLFVITIWNCNAQLNIFFAHYITGFIIIIGLFKI